MKWKINRLTKALLLSVAYGQQHQGIPHESAGNADSQEDLTRTEKGSIF